MPFINSTQTIIQKSSNDILNFYLSGNRLFLRVFENNVGWKNDISVIENIKSNDLDLRIDDEDMIYGISHINNGDVLYFYTKDSYEIKYNKLFNYDTTKYILKYPYIRKINSNIHIIYYLQDKKDSKVWALFNHYFDGTTWKQNSIDFIVAYPMINPFVVSCNSSDLSVVYFNQIDGNEEIFISKFDLITQSWTKPLQITNTKNKKMYLNILYDNINSFHITWCELSSHNLVVKYINSFLKEDIISNLEIISLSEPSNCSFPTLIKTNEVIWNVWVQMNKLYSSYSADMGKTWSKPNECEESIDINFIRYKFESNNINDINKFKLDTTFGTFYPKISFIGFKNINKI